ncbi:MAG: hypothetical protein BWY57_01878 [Betaproteobacteria bacterium ADurb.Bin341]|nr:MAG: hypothetical protein BWY57_01878 [Betaproteobacteria bacterium ADurb.Bin341]
MQKKTCLSFWAASLALFLCLSASIADRAHAQAKHVLTDDEGKSVPLQTVIGRQISRGPIYVVIPVAYVFGLGDERNPHYCSPSVVIANSSFAVVEELVIGIEYRNSTGQIVGSSASRFEGIKVQREDTHHFYQLATSSCKGVEGKLSVLRCKYSTGMDCSKDVEAISFGAIPLRTK